MRICFKLFALLWMSHNAYAGVIYGVDRIQDTYRMIHYPAYVQVGSFSTIRAAEHLQHQMHLSNNVPTVIHSSGNLHKVRMGPFHHPSDLKAFASKMDKGERRQQFKQQSIGRSQLSEPPVLPRQRVALTDLLQQGSHPEFSVFLGGSYVPNTIKGQTLQLLPYEIGPYADTFTNQSGAGAFTWGLEALYRFKLHAPTIQNHFFDSLGAGVDFFQSPDFHQSGKVLQFNLPEFENYTYTLKLNTLRVMANFDLELHPVRQYFIPFIQGGVGGARTEVSYNSVPIPPVVSPDFTLPNESSWRFAYQAGAGVKYVAQPHVVLSLRYLYANMGKVNSSTEGSTTTLAMPLTVNMGTQNFLFGLTYVVE
jgi:opacity protein-like surface antigen